MALVGYYDTAVLVSGDGDLAMPLMQLVIREFEVSVYALWLVIACSMLLTVTWISIWLKKISKTRSVDASYTSGIGYREQSDKQPLFLAKLF